ncbi:MAG: response regulator transcription factor [Cytophagales bacterium]|nr:response regulator transcription factor [Cytophagales bacterium]MCA6373924.1 response regulator transcription factor [Cytophagales bacterium]MCA6377859.1 response regulator transcription factor [Cytophagales bacterium]MCA6385898.1 response regulator transcription factor [Cytophagales bacterium]
MTKIKLAIAEDHKQYRKAIVHALLLENNFEVVLLADNGVDLLEQLKNIVPDIILMDIRMPHMDGLKATDQVREQYPKIKIIALSQHYIESNIIKMYIQGVRSFVGKEDDLEELFKAIKVVYQGGAYMTERSFEIIQRNLTLVNGNTDRLEISKDDKIIINMILEGLTSKQIGEKLNKSHRTIEDIREKLYVKLRVNNKMQLVALATKRNLR